jgi:hypothetical protein
MWPMTAYGQFQAGLEAIHVSDATTGVRMLAQDVGSGKSAKAVLRLSVPALVVGCYLPQPPRTASGHASD